MVNVETVDLITWDDSLSVNVAEIDKQHKKLIALINQLHTAMRERKGHKELGDVIDGLIDYTANHFAFEEKYFDDFKYPKTEEHIKEHIGFIDKISEFKKGFDEGQIMLSMDIMVFLKSWLINHIQGTDKQYSAFFNEKGLK